MKKKRLGDILLERGTLGQADIDRALVLQREKNARLGEILMQNLHVSKTEIATALEQMEGIPYVECPPAKVAPEAVALLPRSIAVKCCALPLEIRGSTLVVALAEPQDLKVLEELRFSSGRSVSPRFSFREDIQLGIRKIYDGEDLAKSLVLKDVDFTTRDEVLPASADEEETLTQLEFIVANSREENKETLKELRAGTRKRTYAVRLLSMILARAAQREASDLHLEPRVDSTVVRMRVDGILRDLMKLPQGQNAGIVLRIKNLSDMDAGAHRIPQEGRFLVIHKGRRLDIRVSTLPTYFGEKILHKEAVTRMYVPAECSLCENTGYRGRIGIFELLLLEGTIREAIQSDTPTHEIRKMLPGIGFRTMQQDGLDKVVRGQTTLEEILRTLPQPN